MGDVVRKGLEWLMKRQDVDGCLGPRDQSKLMYTHAIGTLVLAEAFGMSGSKVLRDRAQKSVDFLLAAQNPGMGWRYGIRSGESDSSVTGWAVLALESARRAGLSLSPQGLGGARAWFDEVTDPKTGEAGYVHVDPAKDTLEGGAKRSGRVPTMTAISLASRVLMNPNLSDSRLSDGCDLLLLHKPRWTEHERCIKWDDPELGIDWPQGLDIQVSDKDAQGTAFTEAEYFD